MNRGSIISLSQQYPCHSKDFCIRLSICCVLVQHMDIDVYDQVDLHAW